MSSQDDVLIRLLWLNITRPSQASKCRALPETQGNLALFYVLNRTNIGGISIFCISKTGARGAGRKTSWSRGRDTCQLYHCRLILNLNQSFFHPVHDHAPMLATHYKFVPIFQSVVLCYFFFTHVCSFANTTSLIKHHDNVFSKHIQQRRRFQMVPLSPRWPCIRIECRHWHANLWSTSRRIGAAGSYAVKLMVKVLSDDTFLLHAYEQVICSEVLWAATWICEGYCRCVIRIYSLLICWTIMT